MKNQYLETMRLVFERYTKSDTETIDKAILYISRNTEEGVLQCLTEVLNTLKTQGQMIEVSPIRVTEKYQIH